LIGAPPGAESMSADSASPAAHATLFRRRRTVAANDELGHVNNVVWLRHIVQLAHAIPDNEAS
jgi:hypothetical protein